MPTDDLPDKEFLLLSVPDEAEFGSTLKLLGRADTLAAAVKAVEDLGNGQLGRIYIVERKAVFLRRAAVENIRLDKTSTT